MFLEASRKADTAEVSEEMTPSRCQKVKQLKKDILDHIRGVNPDRVLTL